MNAEFVLFVLLYTLLPNIIMFLVYIKVQSNTENTKYQHEIVYVCAHLYVKIRYIQ